MYRIGICDDAESVCTSLKEMILKFAHTHHVPVKTETWHTGEELCQYLKAEGQIDLLFLDIVLFEMSGVEVGDFIRNYLEDRKMQIVYISEKPSYALELFRTQPMEFLVKPIMQEQMDRCLKLAVKLIGRNRKTFVCQNGKETFNIPCGEIFYFTSEGRKVKIFTVYGVREFYGKLKDVLKEVPEQFLVIHKSYIVNRERVFRYTYESVAFADGTRLPISKAHRKRVREIFGKRESR